MTTEESLVPADVVDDRRRQAALLRAVGLDRVPPEQREIAMAIAKKYDLDLLLKHVVLVDGRPFVTRDGLLWIAHRSGQLDGIEVTEPAIVTLPGVGEFWRAVCTVWRKDMSRPFVYAGRYPTKGGNTRFAPEMAVKVAESMALRRAFNVSAPTIDERFDLADVQANVDAVSTPQQPPRTLAERVQERRASMGPPSISGPAGPSPDEDEQVLRAAQEEGRRQIARMRAEEDDEVTQAMGSRRLEEAGTADLVEGLEDELVCGDEDVSPMALGICDLPPRHKGFHHSDNGTWQ